MTREILHLRILDYSNRITFLTSLICSSLFQHSINSENLEVLIRHQQQQFANLRAMLCDYGATVEMMERFDTFKHDLNVGYLLLEANISLAREE